MKMVSFRTDSDKYRDLADYASDKGTTVSELLNRLIDSLIMGETALDLNGLNVMALKGRVERLEELLVGKGDASRDGKSPEARQEGEMTAEEIQAMVREILDDSERKLAGAIAEETAEQIVKGGAKATEVKEQFEQIAGLMESLTTKMGQLYDSQTKLAEIVIPLKEQAEKRNVHATAEEMISCSVCGPFFLDAVRIARDNLAEQDQAKAEAEAEVETETKVDEEPELKTSPGYFPGSKWDEEKELYIEQR